MSNLDVFVDYGTKMVKHSNEMAVVGTIGSGLTKKELRTGVRKILKRNKLTVKQVDVQYGDNAVIFTHK